MRKLMTVAAGFGTLAVAAAGASAAAPAVGLAGSYTIGIRGFVPVICRASLESSLATPRKGSQSLGALSEFCNSPSGYQVIASYSPELAKAKLVVDGHSVPLSASGATVVSQSNRAAIETRQVSLELPKDIAGGSISFSIRPR